MSTAAADLLRTLLGRMGADQHRIFLTDWTTIDWQSLTFVGERHVAGFIIRGDGARALAERWTDGFGEADLPIGSAAFVADIAATIAPDPREDGAILVTLEALTLET